MRDWYSRRHFLQASVLLGPTALKAASPIPIKPDLSVLPSQTDSQIQSFDQPQAVYLPNGNRRNQLLILLPGTNGENEFGLRFCRNASLLGYHVVQPMYNNDVAATVCQKDDDPDSFSKFRWAIIEGGTNPHLKVPVSRPESIENRTIKLVKFLDRRYPGQAWGQFLDGDNLVWERIAVGGLSQGGGHAALIATKHKVARVLCFGAPKDFSLRYNAPAKWYESSATPASRFFAFNNTHDRQGCDYQQQVANLEKLGITTLAGIANVDKTSAPYNGSHALFTDWPRPTAQVESIRAHVSVISDNIFRTGAPLFRPVWRYMLASPVG